MTGLLTDFNKSLIREIPKVPTSLAPILQTENCDLVLRFIKAIILDNNHKVIASN